MHNFNKALPLKQKDTTQHIPIKPSPDTFHLHGFDSRLCTLLISWLSPLLTLLCCRRNAIWSDQPTFSSSSVELLILIPYPKLTEKGQWCYAAATTFILHPDVYSEWKVLKYFGVFFVLNRSFPQFYWATSPVLSNKNLFIVFLNIHCKSRMCGNVSAWYGIINTAQFNIRIQAKMHQTAANRLTD